MYFIMELQRGADGSCAHLVHTAENRNQAESVYHQVLAAAAISSVPTHSAIMITDAGEPVMHDSYLHETEE